MNKNVFFFVLFFLYGCSEKPLGEHGFTTTDMEKGWFSVKFKHVDGTTKIVPRFQGINTCNAYGEGYMTAQRELTPNNIKIIDYVCCYETKDPECKYELR